MSSGGQASRNFQYMWILRGGSTRSVEFNLIPYLTDKTLLPLLEVTDDQTVLAFAGRLTSNFREVFVDVPRYLLDRSNKFQEALRELLRAYPDPVDFLVTLKSWMNWPPLPSSGSSPFIPVASSHGNVVSPDYSDQIIMVRSLSGQFSPIAVRVAVPQLTITNIASTNNSYTSLLQQLPRNSYVLLDVPVISGYVPVAALNIREMSLRARQMGHKVFVLNAFDPFPTGHNFGPYFAFENQLEGFGDFATEPRIPLEGGGGYSTSIIKYYDHERFRIEEFRGNGYQDAENRLTASTIWQHQSSHRSNCRACLEVEHSNYQVSPAYWKQFRIEHYITCIVNDTQNLYGTVTSGPDLDPIGQDIIIRGSQTG